MPNTFISSVAQNLIERVYLNLPNFGKATRAARSTRLVGRGRQCERRHPMMRNRSPVIFSPMSKFLLSPLHRSVYAFLQGCPHSFPLDVYRQRVSVRL